MTFLLLIFPYTGIYFMILHKESFSLGSDHKGLETRRLLAVTQPFTFSGIANPIACLENGEVMLFLVNKADYPVYDE